LVLASVTVNSTTIKAVGQGCCDAPTLKDLFSFVTNEPPRIDCAENDWRG